ncbi:MAG: 30S ribosomal protein S7 [Planctomycetota bacterium]|jgi:small subunit ribosomal protein S7
MSVKSTKVTGPGLRPDPRYGNLLAAKLINSIMTRGKKSLAEKIFYNAMEIIEEKMKTNDPVKVLEQAIDNIKPIVEVKSRRVGGANYQVPVQVSPKRQQTLAIRWLMQAAHAKKGKPMHQILANELLDAYKKEGAAMSVRENTHRMAEANKAFAHFAW